MVLFTLRGKVVLTSESVDAILRFDHLKVSYSQYEVQLPCGAAHQLILKEVILKPT